MGQASRRRYAATLDGAKLARVNASASIGNSFVQVGPDMRAARVFRLIQIGALAILLIAAHRASAAIVPVCERTEQVQHAILRKVAEADACGQVTDEHLAGIEELFVFADSSLRAGDFSGLTALTELTLQRGLGDPPRGLFEGLEKLETLELLYDSLQPTLEPDVFKPLANLKTLRIRYASAPDTLPATIFSGLSSLELLFLSESRRSMTISQLTPGVCTNCNGAMSRVDLPPFRRHLQWPHELERARSVEKRTHGSAGEYLQRPDQPGDTFS